MTVPADQTLTAHMTRFARRLRARGIDVAYGDELDGLRALSLVDLGDPQEVRLALRTGMKVVPADWPAFDALFAAMWRQAGGKPPAAAAAPEPQLPPYPAPSPPLFEIRRPAGAAAATEPDSEPQPAGGDEAGYSPVARLRRKSFDACDTDDLAAMQPLLARLARRLATRRSRRRRPARRGDVIDLRRSFRRSLASGGELAELARRRRAVELPRIVLLCDTSGSMDAHSRFLLSFALALKKVAPRTEAFALDTRLTRLTPWLAPGDILATLERLAGGVADWSGGTRLGACLSEFVERFLDRTVDSDTVVVIFSDGLDRGDIGLLEAAMLRLRRRAGKVIWLNPLMGDPRYRPEARGMRAALPYVDDLLAAHDLASLEALLPHLGARGIRTTPASPATDR